jgi:ABC-type uncharacterized transport system auxiliary subunit
MTSPSSIRCARPLFNAAVAGIALLLLSSCGSLMSQREPISYYRLSHGDIDRSLTAEAPAYDFVKVDLPHLTTTHAADAILYSAALYQQDAYSKSQWSVALPTMLQGWLIETLSSTGLFKGVIRSASRAHASHLIETDIIRFEHVVYQSKAAIALRISLLDLKHRRLIKQKVFRYQLPLDEQSAGSAVRAFNRLMLQFNRDLFLWLK